MAPPENDDQSADVADKHRFKKAKKRLNQRRSEVHPRFTTSLPFAVICVICAICG